LNLTWMSLKLLCSSFLHRPSDANYILLVFYNDTGIFAKRITATAMGKTCKKYFGFARFYFQHNQ